MNMNIQVLEMIMHNAPFAIIIIIILSRFFLPLQEVSDFSGSD